MYNTNLHFHFTGIGGSGMSGIAEILLSLGFKVSGSDLRPSSMTERLVSRGATVFSGHDASNLPKEASLVVYSSAVRSDNPELVEASKRGIPVIRRAEVLAELMRLKFGVAVGGSHGKTTTTTMIGNVMERGGLDPTVVIGGQVKTLETGARAGKGEYLVAESDESDRSFLLLRPTVAVVTNIDSEHLSAYESYSELERSFEQFVEAVPFYGIAILCIDCPRVRDIYTRYKGRKISYGLSPDAMLRPQGIKISKGRTEFEVLHNGKKILDIDLPLPGTHFMVNALAAVAVGIEFGVEPKIIEEALSSFPVVRRRTEVVGVTRGVTVINDYGHHPTEIKATIDAVRAGWIEGNGKLHVVFQPHRYTRTRDCFVDFLHAFDGADSLLLTEIYSAGEDPIEGVSGQTLADAIIHTGKEFVAKWEECSEKLNGMVKPGDVILCLGAGSIGHLPEQAVKYLSAHSPKPALVA